ncbi:hypothetical protein [Saccharopolyspora rhizosphaerae]|nr:hypothetical protein [Saccharopolyspora rhizosphaerae]
MPSSPRPRVVGAVVVCLVLLWSPFALSLIDMFIGRSMLNPQPR